MLAAKSSKFNLFGSATLPVHRSIILSPSHGIWGGGQIYIESLSQLVDESGGSAPIVTSEPSAFDSATIAIPRIDDRRERLRRAIPMALDLRRRGGRRILLNDLSALWMAPAFRLAGFEVGSLLHLHPEPRSSVGIGHSAMERRVLWLGSRACHRIFSVNRQNVASFGARVDFVGNYAPNHFFEQASSAGVSDKPYDLIFVARLAPQKNPSLFVDIVADLRRHLGRSVRALLVGDGPDAGAVDDRIAVLDLGGPIDRMPWVPRNALPALLDRAKCFVMTSLYEGFATTVIEAHARGLPAVVTESSGFCPEFVREFGGTTGVVFDKDRYDATTLSAEIADLLERAGALAPRCRAKAARFTRESVLAPIQQWLMSV